jgi:hypothetical protein
VPTPTTEPTASENQIFEVGAELVWEFRADFSHLPDYNPDVTDVDRIVDGDEGGAGARYRFQLADARRPGVTHPVELWTVEVAKPTLVVAGMQGGNEAYEEFVIEPITRQSCRATLSLWVSLPNGLSPEVIEQATMASRQQLRKELDLMKEVLEG